MSWKAPGNSVMIFFFYIQGAVLLTLKSPCSRIALYILSVGKATEDMRWVDRAQKAGSGGMKAVLTCRAVI